MSAIIERLPAPQRRSRQRIARPSSPRPEAAARAEPGAGLLARLPWRLRAELGLPAAEPELATVLERLRLR